METTGAFQMWKCDLMVVFNAFSDYELSNVIYVATVCQLDYEVNTVACFYLLYRFVKPSVSGWRGFCVCLGPAAIYPDNTYSGRPGCENWKLRTHLPWASFLISKTSTTPFLSTTLGSVYCFVDDWSNFISEDMTTIQNGGCRILYFDKMLQFFTILPIITKSGGNIATSIPKTFCDVESAEWSKVTMLAAAIVDFEEVATSLFNKYVTLQKHLRNSRWLLPPSWIQKTYGHLCSIWLTIAKFRELIATSL